MGEDACRVDLDLGRWRRWWKGSYRCRGCDTKIRQAWTHGWIHTRC